MISDIKDLLKRFFNSRMLVLSTAMLLMFAIILGRVFSLQIINGGYYQDNFLMRIEKTLAVDAARGNIYDCNGKLLAYNELAYSIVINDNGTYEDNDAKNEFMNTQLAEIVEVLQRNNEELYNDFKIELEDDGTYEFKVSGTQLKRFLADVFGKASYDSLGYDKKLGFNTATASAEQVMNYLINNQFEITGDYSQRTMYEVTAIRYAMRSIRYSRYKNITIAEDVGDETLAYVNEHLDEFIGITIEEDTVRRYNDSIYFASILGYTGKISSTEYEELSQLDETYRTDDTVGKSGLEQYYETYLRGVNGEQVVYVDTVGRVREVVSSTEPIAGSDLYISLDADLQKAVYLLLEQQIAGIVYSNIKRGNIPINDVYFTLIDNNVIDITEFDDENASEIEKEIYDDFLVRQDLAIESMREQLYSKNPLINNDMPEDVLDYFTYAFSLLKNDDILVSSKIDTTDSIYVNWRNGELSPREYLAYCITQQWIDITLLDVDDKYADTSEIYDAVCNYILEEAVNDKNFAKYVYKYMVEDNIVTGRQLCMLLMEQTVLDYDEEIYNDLKDGTLLPYDFILEKINYIEITPAQLALDPCTGSCIITDVNTGELKALVSYPGYDNNKLANGVDAEYFAKLNEDNSNPQWNYATQEKTAPGSTFKMLTSVAGLAEGVISTTSEYECTGVFKLVDNEPECWINAMGQTHKLENVVTALRDSCNLYFYNTGYALSTKKDEVYSDKDGISYIQKYASIFGLDQKTGLEIVESQSSVATEYPVMAAIGQSNNNYTTAALSRYVTAISNGKLYDYQLMSKIVDCDGNVLESYEPKYQDISSTLNPTQWNAIRTGMNLVCENNSPIFGGFSFKVAGKTGTAQQVATRPNHALFLCYAPYETPEISVSTRIAYGYGSDNAMNVTKNILAYYFEENTLEELLSLNAEGANSSLDNTITD